ncbi:MAG: excinuclease ABC subunit UvrA [Coriobacteriales bacterium]|jgi:excinuclease ABC subunit A
MQENIVVRGAREHNLKNINVEIPRDKLVVMTGLSGSGKSSLAFDTIYAEGQRRYVESLSSYARQFLGQKEKPDLDSITGLSPAVSIDQKTTSKNPRSTVGTVTEIYDYLRLLYARVGIPHCPVCGRAISKQTVDQVADSVLAARKSGRIIVLAPVVKGRKGEYVKLFEELRAQGFSRVRVDGEVRDLSEPIELNKKVKHDIDVITDRIVIKPGVEGRLVEAIETATTLADNTVVIQFLGENRNVIREESYSLALACPEHGYSIDELNPRDFSFNAPYGACPDCMGIGSKREVDPDLIIPEPKLSLAEGACVAVSMRSNFIPQVMNAAAEYLGVSLDTPWKDYPASVKKAFLYGIKDRIMVHYHTRDGRDTHWTYRWEGLVHMVEQKYEETDSDRTKARYDDYFAVIPCNTCHGSRLKPSVLAVTVGGKNIYEVTQMTAAQSLEFFKGLEFEGSDLMIAGRIVKEIVARLQFLVNVGLDYLTLERATATLSGGEAQRIRLATQIGAGLMGVLYVLDEPSIGLHQRDNARLIDTLKNLRDLGNTVVVVEHDEETIRSADYVIDMGPGAGENGGYVVATGSPEEIEKCTESITGDYLAGRKQIEIPEKRRNPRRGNLELLGASENNLKNINIKIPIGTFTVVTGVSGSGKSSLVTDTLAPLLANKLNHAHRRVGKYRNVKGLQLLDKIIDIDQSPIGRTPRSNPATYIGLWDDIRQLFASTPESKARGYSAGRFSFNVSGGRCEACKGDGQLKIEMHFLPDIYVPCEVCHGARYNRETLQVTYKGKNVADILDMTVETALKFFEYIPQIKGKLQTMYDVGLGYMRLGQPATTLSGGEAQRVKLASELRKRSTGKTLYVLDEPTTGLHFDDVRQLLEVLQRLVDRGNTVLVIEHNLDVIKCADRIIDLGPEGGDGGGTVVAYGTPEQVAECEQSYTGQFLRKILGKSAKPAKASKTAVASIASKSESK